MGYEPYHIANYEEESGLENYFESFLLPEKAFPVLKDAYCWRGRVKRRQGCFLLGRLRRVVGGGQAPATLNQQALAGTTSTTIADLFADPAINLRAPPAPVVQETNAEIEAYSPGIPVVLVISVGAYVFTDLGTGILAGTGGSSGRVTYITTTPPPASVPTSPITLTYPAPLGVNTNITVTFAYFPSLPVMGLRTYEMPNINYEMTIGFDQKYAYQYDYVNRDFEELTAPGTTWRGSNSKYFWTTNYWNNANGRILWTANFNAGANGDPIRYYDSTAWTNFAPPVDAAAPNPNRLQQCLAILPFKQRLLCFNTWEGTTLAAATNYPQRIRWSWVGDPTDAAIHNAWLSTPGNGGFIEVYTDEHIVSVEYLKDVILVKCEQSSWKLLYTGNQASPFTLQKINSTFGTGSTYSLVPFDEGVYCIGDNGITTDDTTSVERIDIKIPDQAFRIQISPERAYGIRDYTNELVYWAYTDQDLNANPSSVVFNNQVLVYNYRNSSWAKFNDSYTAFGVFQIANPNSTYFPPTFIPYSPNIAAGNQEGFVEILNRGSKQVTLVAPFFTFSPVLNSPSLAITGVFPASPAIIRCPNHNLSAGATYWIRIDGIIGTGPNNPSVLNFDIANNRYLYKVTSISANDLLLFTYNVTTSSFEPYNLPVGGSYLGGGKVTIVQNFDIKTKVFAPFYEQGQQVRLGYVDFLLDTTTSGQTGCNMYVNEYPVAINDPALIAADEGLVGTNILLTSPENTTLIPMQPNQAKIWHRIFTPAIGENFQLEIQMTDAEMSSQSINNNDFVMHAMTLYLSPNARMTQ